MKKDYEIVEQFGYFTIREFYYVDEFSFLGINWIKRIFTKVPQIKCFYYPTKMSFETLQQAIDFIPKLEPKIHLIKNKI